MKRSHTARPGAWTRYRGSKKRLQGTTVSRYSPRSFWIYVILFLTVLAALFRVLTTAPAPP